MKPHSTRSKHTSLQFSKYSALFSFQRFLSGNTHSYIDCVGAEMCSQDGQGLHSSGLDTWF